MTAESMRGSGIMVNNMGPGNTSSKMVSLGWVFGRTENASNGSTEMKRLMKTNE